MEDLKIWVSLLWTVVTISFGLLACYHYILFKKRLPEEIILTSDNLYEKTSAETKSFINQFNRLNKSISLAQMIANIVSCMAAIASLSATLLFM